MNPSPKREFEIEAFVVSLILTPMLIGILVFGYPGRGTKLLALIFGALVFTFIIWGISLAGVLARNSSLPWIFFVFLGLVFTAVFLSVFLSRIFIFGGN